MFTTNLASPEKSQIRGIFDSIAPRYDFINSFLSMRLDESWRRRALQRLFTGNENSLLDIGTGTGRFLELFLKKKTWKIATGLDFSKEMLHCARKSFGAKAGFACADFHDLPFRDESFDLVVSSFALRSVKNLRGFLNEVYRVLMPGGKAGLLCLTRPHPLFYKTLYYPYLKIYLPLAGQFISGNRQAYRFLSDSIQHFQDPAETLKMMSEVGFKELGKHRFTMGASTLVVGEK